jgi:hypothetical protein
MFIDNDVPNPLRVYHRDALTRRIFVDVSGSLFWLGNGFRLRGLSAVGNRLAKTEREGKHEGRHGSQRNKKGGRSTSAHQQLPRIDGQHSPTPEVYIPRIDSIFRIRAAPAENGLTKASISGAFRHGVLLTSDITGPSAELVVTF